MITTTFNALDQWKMLPIYSVELYFAQSDTNYVLENPVKGSFASINPVYSARKSDKGGQYVAAFKLACKMITSQSNIVNFQPLLHAVKNEVLTDVRIKLLSADNNIVLEVQSGDSALVKDLSAVFDITYNEESMGPVLSFDIQALLSTDILISPNFSQLITQSWG